MDIPREQQDVLLAMGVAVLHMQITEKVIRLCMTLVLPKETPLTFEALEKKNKSERNKTLGYFLSELRQRADIHDGFDALLEEFLKNRNDFVHDLSRVPGWQLGSREQTAKARKFVHQLIEQSDAIVKVFLGLISAWEAQVGMPKHSTPSDAFFDEIETVYKPLVDQIFFAKDA